MGISPSLSPVSHKNRQSWLMIGFLAVIYGPVIFHWYDGWLNKSISTEHEYFSHGLIGLPYAAYIVWQNRKKKKRPTAIDLNYEQ